MLRRLALVAAVSGLAGCGRIGFESGDDGTVDASGPCSTVGADTVALYRFEAGGVTDETGEHNGMVELLHSIVPGPCGGALMLDPDHHAIVPDSTEFDLPTGSIELRIQIEDMTTALSRIVLSRDAAGTSMDGHMSIGVSPGGNVFVRMQHTPTIIDYRCSAPVSTQTWMHIGVSFGGDPATEGLQLWVDHEVAAGGAFVEGGSSWDCTVPHDWGMEGNNNALVIGAANWDATEGETDPFISAYAHNIVIDEIHIRSTWRNFANQ